MITDMSTLLLVLMILALLVVMATIHEVLGDGLGRRPGPRSHASFGDPQWRRPLL